MAKPGLTPSEVSDTLSEFQAELAPLESSLLLLEDKRTGARYVECHVQASKLNDLATTDVPLDPDEQPDYRANRQIMANHAAFAKMKDDALLGRTFSNIVSEYTKDFDPTHPLKIVGGQHRFEAIRFALASGVDEHHGIKVYLALTLDQRLDVQLISNTSIAISADLFDRLQETALGPDLRDWCQNAGLLEPDIDFADRRERGGPIPVRLARTLIINYYLGKSVDAKSFGESETTPYLAKSGIEDDAWEELKRRHPKWSSDAELQRAATEFALLVRAQREAFAGRTTKPKPDFPEKAMNPAILAAWTYVAGMLHDNPQRLERHFALKSTKGRDPLNAEGLAGGRHKSDPENYRGLGYRVDVRERGRLVELFYLQAEDGRGITAHAIDLAIRKYHAKVAILDVRKAEQR